ncbi:hypothetical protein APR04_004272 [Promicromonospora umidemergens]|nr:hypothetical protein [Promicromonospora umidemergens]MCP2285340.1 hypothetical protein [Promicromonospora umidemergens]
MPTPVLRRYLPSARRACASLIASGLVLGLATTTAGAAPARAESPPAGLPAAVVPTATESLDPAFVQEGMPSGHGGQVVAWGDRAGAYDPASSQRVPAAFPDGVHATAISTDGSDLLILRSDGRVVDPSLADPQAAVPPDGMTYVAVAAMSNRGGRLLRSDGAVVSQDGQHVMEPPDGTTYTAIAGLYVLRSDGVLEAPAGDPATCTDALVPGPGLSYTAISARGSMYRWAALRSDGAYVYCEGRGAEEAAKVIRPPSGTRFIGIDMGRSDVLAATADGRVLSSASGRLAAAPPSRSIISLTAMEDGQGAAALDDGTIMSWGMDSENSALPGVPADRAAFSAVGGDTGHGIHWAIMIGDAIPVEVVVDNDAPQDRVPRVTDTVRFDVTATLADGTPADGTVTLNVQAPDGRTSEVAAAGAFGGTGEAVFALPDHEQVGTYDVDVTFLGSPYVTTAVRTSLDLAEPSPVVITASGPTSWPATSEDTLCFDLATEDGSPRWSPHDDVAITVDGHPEHDYATSGVDRVCLDSLQLRQGSYTVHVRYEGWGAADAASLTADVVVLRPWSTDIWSDLPTSWRYGQMPDSIRTAVSSIGPESSTGPVPVGTVDIEHENGTPFGSSMVLGETGHADIGISHEEELVPGEYPMMMRYRGGYGFFPTRLRRTVWVLPAVFTATPDPTITGTAKVGSKLTADPGTWSPVPTKLWYAWYADRKVVTGATTRTFTVPASAAGKTITVRVGAFKEHYRRSSSSSAPTAVVARGTFTAPRPTITGTAKVGRTLTVNRGAWSPVPSSVKYVWKANGTTIATRTSNKFVVPPSAWNKRLTVTVTGSRAGYTTKSVAKEATAKVAAGTFTAQRPTITGTTRVGSTLTVGRGTWSPTPSSVTYLWRADGVLLDLRTSNRFVIPSQARGKRLTVTVVGSRTGYTTKSVASYRTAAIR